MQKIMDAARIQELVAELAAKLLDDPTLRQVRAEDIALVGIRSRGELLAERIAAEMRARQNVTTNVGALDITMYRDDFAYRGAVTIPQGTEMNFQVDEKIVILIDDVLATGRSVRAALDAISDFGRPSLIRLLALVDRGGREYPIAADYVGVHVDVSPEQKVLVRLQPTDAEDAVYLEDKTGSEE